MNQNGEYFSGFERGKFKWSFLLSDAKPLDRVEQCQTIIRNEPLMEIVYDYI